MTREDILLLLAHHRTEIRRRFAVRDLALFGSLARDEARADSDIDILVDFEGRADFDRFMDLKFYLEDLLDTSVDLVTRKGLRPQLRSSIEREAVHVP